MATNKKTIFTKSLAVLTILILTILGFLHFNNMSSSTKTYLVEINSEYPAESEKNEAKASIYRLCIIDKSSSLTDEQLIDKTLIFYNLSLSKDNFNSYLVSAGCSYNKEIGIPEITVK